MGEPARELNDDPSAERRSPIERRIAKAFTDEGGKGKPLSRRARQTRRTLEAYLRGGSIPRYMERLHAIEAERRRNTLQLERAYRVLRQRCGDDPVEFERRWRETAERWRFDRINELIREHNEWYPVERDLALDPRTGDYVRIRGRSYRRAELGPAWVLERFPPVLS